MGYGIGTDHVDVSVPTTDRTNFHTFLSGLKGALGSLIKAGCSEFKIQIHEHGAVVTGNQPVVPRELTEEDKLKSLKEILER